MKWVKKGLIYSKSATTPTPILLSPSTIRIYAGFPDSKGVSRIGYVDVRADNPKKILRISKKPVLGIGKPGTFDDNGVILGDVVRVGNILRMYYVGFQHVQNVKFFAFAGLAVSRDNGETFTRTQDTPILDRAPGARFIRVIHSVIQEPRHWNIWTAEGDSWQIIRGRPYPRYSIYYAQSKDGLTLNNNRVPAITPRGKEYRVGRPRVYKTKKGYEMYYTAGTTDKKFFSGYATSVDGIKWKRQDSEIDFGPVMYPSVIQVRNTTYMFYNSIGFGKSGFGYAILAPSTRYEKI